MPRKFKDNVVPLSEAALQFAPRALVSAYEKLQRSQYPEFPEVEPENSPEAIKQLFGAFKGQIDHFKTRNQPMWEMQNLLIAALLNGKLKARGIQTKPTVSNSPEMIPAHFFKNIRDIKWGKDWLDNFGRRFEGVEVMRLKPERLKRIALRRKLIRKCGKRWIVSARLPRRMLLFTDGRELIVTTRSSKSASLIGRYMTAVRHFLRTNDPSGLAEFAVASIKDTTGKVHPFEINPNVLYQLNSAGGEPFEDIYRIVI